jgi:hypothetical protein
MPVVVSELCPKMSATCLKLAPLRTMVVAIVWRLCRMRHSRHGFAVERLLTWYRSNLDVRALTPHLSVYLGYISKEETY